MGNIRDSKSISQSNANKLEKANIRTTDDLINQCCDAQGRDRVSQQSGINSDELKSMAQREEIHQVRGLNNGEYDSLLEASGVSSLHDLSQQDSHSLYNNMQNINDKQHLSHRTPSEKDVDGFVNEAKQNRSKIK